MNKLKRMLLGVIIITTALNGMGQMKISRIHDTITRRTIISPINLMKFSSPKNSIDTLYLSVFIDSLNVKMYVPYLYVGYPKNIDHTGNLKIGYSTGEIDIFKQEHVDYTDSIYNYITFWMTRNQKDKLKNVPYDYIGFEKVANCIRIKEPTFFMQFLKDY